MRILITGSTKLAGAIIDAFNEEILFEKTYVDSCRVHEVPEKLGDYDVFINNAHVDFWQTELLHEAYKQWKDDEDKLIINMSSRAGKNNISRGYLYSAQKASLIQLAENLNYNSDKVCGICTIHLGLLETPKFEQLPPLLEAVSYGDVCQLLEDIMFNFKTNRTFPTEITIEHRANYKEIQRQKKRMGLTQLFNKINWEH